MFEALVYFVPIDGSPPGGEVVGTLVLVLEVVGVLPDIVAQDGIVPLGNWTVLVRGGDDFQLSAFKDQPSPAGTKLLSGGFIEQLFEVGEAAEVFLDLLRDLACGVTAPVGLHDGPEHAVIHMTAAVVPHHAANIFRNGV